MKIDHKSKRTLIKNIEMKNDTLYALRSKHISYNRENLYSIDDIDIVRRYNGTKRWRKKRRTNRIVKLLITLCYLKKKYQYK